MMESKDYRLYQKKTKMIINIQMLSKILVINKSKFISTLSKKNQLKKEVISLILANKNLNLQFANNNLFNKTKLLN